MFEFFKRKPKVETVSKAEHERIVAVMQRDIDGQTDACRSLARRLSEAAGERDALRVSIEEERKTWVSTSMRLAVANSRLREIAALETPNCAHIGKRMARIARGEDAQGREKGEAA